MPPEPVVLSAQGLQSQRAGRPVHPPVAFTLAAGDALLLRGANGSGKSTLLRTLAGFMPSLTGELRFRGVRVEDDPGSWTESLHWLGHQNGLKPMLTVRDNLAVAARLLGGEARIEAAAGCFGLDGFLDEPAAALSQGLRRRAALARLLVVERVAWLMDEPGVGLDAGHRRRLEDAIDRHRRQGGIVVAASHGDVTLDEPLVLDL